MGAAIQSQNKKYFFFSMKLTTIVFWFKNIKKKNVKSRTKKKKNIKENTTKFGVRNKYLNEIMIDFHVN